MKSIFIKKNIAQALEYSKEINLADARYFYIKSPHVLGQRARQEREDFLFLKSKLPSIIEITSSEAPQYNGQENIYFGWNAVYEEELVKRLEAERGKQNRLLDDYHFSEIKTYTPFRKEVEKKLPQIFETNTYQPDDEVVLNELKYYFEETHLAKKYFDIRNGVMGRDYSTKFSTHLASGRLNVRYLYNYLKKYEQEYGANKSTYWIQFEILWREYFYWSYQKYQELYFSKNGLRGEAQFNRELPSLNHEELFANDPFMTAVCSELLQTGFISNRLRQVFASALINTYQVDWRVGANFFELHLIDYDVYSNWGNWQYLAGIGHDPRGSREFNVIKQLSEHDTNFKYIKHWTGLESSEEISKALSAIYSR